MANNSDRKPSLLPTEEHSCIDDWQGNLGLADCNRQMLIHQICCDVFFRVGKEGERIGAHKYVLASRSSVFFAMFEGPVAETQKEIVVCDIDPGVFWKLLRFMYCEETNHDNDTVLELLYSATKYSLKLLAQSCTDFIEKSLTPDTACGILQQGYVFDDLKMSVLNYIWKNGEDVMRSYEFRHLSQALMEEIIKSDELKAEETTVVEAILEWATCCCEVQETKPTGKNKRKIIGKSLDFVRFPLLNMRYFVEHVSSAEIFTLEELCRLYECFAVPTRWQNAFVFPTDVRKFQRLRICRRFQELSSYPFYLPSFSYTETGLAFSCSGNIFLHGFTVFGSFGGDDTQYDIDTRVYEGTYSIILSQHFVVHSTGRRTEVYFGEKILLRASRLYRLVLGINGPCMRQGANGTEQVTADDIKFTFGNFAGNQKQSYCEGPVGDLLFTMAK